jgi:hypothetical protein
MVNTYYVSYWSNDRQSADYLIYRGNLETSDDLAALASSIMRLHNLESAPVILNWKLIH